MAVFEFFVGVFIGIVNILVGHFSGSISKDFSFVKFFGVNVKNANFQWTRTAMSLKSPTYSILGSWAPHYFPQEISNTTFSRRFRRNIGPSLLFTQGFSDP